MNRLLRLQQTFFRVQKQKNVFSCDILGTRRRQEEGVAGEGGCGGGGRGGVEANGGLK